jgi:Rps23 Pro-64 3,4-dihydroxylase Tpa1-like proline 4-hydroxylase
MDTINYKNKEFYVETILNRIEEGFKDLQDKWNNPQATPTKHLIIDNLLPEKEALEIFDAFPRDGSGFFNRDTFREKKKTSQSLDEFNSILGEITYALQDQRVIDAVSELTGFKSLEPDPMLYAGGLSMMFKDDFLNPHIDNSHDANRSKYRRLNLLYYVSPEWKKENGANFELWNESRDEVKTITSKFNRLVIMETNKLSWHSVSTNVSNEPRCCVSNYYFSEISPEDSEYFHVTSFSGRPEQFGKIMLGKFDNYLRNTFSKITKIGRGKK